MHTKKDHSSWKKGNMLGVGVKNFCDQEGDIHKAKEKRDVSEKEQIFLFTALKRSWNDELVILIF